MYAGSPLLGDPFDPEVRALVALIRPAGAPERGPWEAQTDQGSSAQGVDIPMCTKDNGDTPMVREEVTVGA